MALNWKFLVPLAIANVLVIAFLIQVLKALGLMPVPGADIIAHLPMTVVMLLGNLVIIAVAMQVLRNQGREEKMAQEARMAARQQRVVKEVRTPAGAPVGD